MEGDAVHGGGKPGETWEARKEEAQDKGDFVMVV